MKNILMLCLTIGLLVSSMSCGDKGEIVDYIVISEVHYENETGVSPIQLDFYSNNALKVSVSINKDTTFVATENNGYGWMLPANHDSVVVKFGDVLSKTYRDNEYEEGIKNPCRSECYEKEDISNTKRKFSFSFTKDMLE